MLFKHSEKEELEQHFAGETPAEYWAKYQRGEFELDPDAPQTPKKS